VPATVHLPVDTKFISSIAVQPSPASAAPSAPTGPGLGVVPELAAAATKPDIPRSGPNVGTAGNLSEAVARAKAIAAKFARQKEDNRSLDGGAGQSESAVASARAIAAKFAQLQKPVQVQSIDNDSAPKIHIHGGSDVHNRIKARETARMRLALIKNLEFVLKIEGGRIAGSVEAQRALEERSARQRAGLAAGEGVVETLLSRTAEGGIGFLGAKVSVAATSKPGKTEMLFGTVSGAAKKAGLGTPAVIGSRKRRRSVASTASLYLTGLPTDYGDLDPQEEGTLTLTHAFRGRRVAHIKIYVDTSGIPKGDGVVVLDVGAEVRGTSLAVGEMVERLCKEVRILLCTMCFRTPSSFAKYFL